MSAASGQAKENAISLTTARLPLVDVRFAGVLTVAEYRAMLDELVKIFSRDPSRKYILLLDMRDFNPLHINAKMRKDAAAVWHENRELWLRCVAAEARVIVNPLVRGMVTAFDWLTGIGKWPCRQFARIADAEIWLNSEYEKSR